MAYCAYFMTPSLEVKSTTTWNESLLYLWVREWLSILVARTLSCKVNIQTVCLTDWILRCVIRAVVWGHSTFFTVGVCDYGSILMLPLLCLSWNTLLSSERSCHWNEPRHWLDNNTSEQRPLQSIHGVENTVTAVYKASSDRMVPMQWQGTNSEKGVHIAWWMIAVE